MKTSNWIQQRKPDWETMESLLRRAEPSLFKLPLADIRTLAWLYRGILHDVIRARSSDEYSYLAPYLNNLAQRAHAVVFVQSPLQAHHIWDFFSRQFPRCFRKHFGVIALAFLTFVLGAIISMAVVAHDADTATFFLPPAVINLVKSGHLWMDTAVAAPSQASMLMTNNIKVAFNAYVMGIFMGIGTLWVLFNNGMYALGGPLQICINYGMGAKLIWFMVAHGPLELATIFISGGAGMIMGLALLFPGEYSRWDALRDKAHDSLILIMGCVPLLFVAGIIEGNISLNAQVAPMSRVIIGVGTFLLLVLYLAFSGREEKRDHTKGLV